MYTNISSITVCFGDHSGGFLATVSVSSGDAKGQWDTGGST
jgi:hypothetical protein